MREEENEYGETDGETLLDLLIVLGQMGRLSTSCSE